MLLFNFMGGNPFPETGFPWLTSGLEAITFSILALAMNLVFVMHKFNLLNGRK